MATAKQIQLRLGQAKKKLAKLNKELTATKAKGKTLEAQLKKAKAAEKAKPKKKAAPKKKAPAKKKVAAKKKAPAKRKAPARKKK